MKIGYLTIDGGRKDTGESILVLDMKEAKILNDSLEEYCKKHPRRKNAKKIFKEFDGLIIGWGNIGVVVMIFNCLFY